MVTYPRKMLQGRSMLDWPEPYRSVPVVPIEALAYFPRCARARAVLCKLVVIRSRGSSGWFLPRCRSCLRRATWPNFSCPLRQREYQIVCSTNRRCRAAKTGSLIRRARVGCFALAELAPEPIPRLCQTGCGKRRLWFVEKRVTEAEGMVAEGQPANAVLRWGRLSHSEDARAPAPDSSLSPKVAALSCLSAVRTRAL